MQISTTGVLNHVCELYHCNSVSRTVAIQNIIRFHKPKQERELVALINSHQCTGQHNNCACGSKSKGTLEDFAKDLHKSFLDFKQKSKELHEKSFDDCYAYMKNLFITNSLRGYSMEDKAMQLISSKLPTDFTIQKSKQMEDVNYAIDLILFDNIFECYGKKKSNDFNKKSLDILGFQVKPISYQKYSHEHPVVQMNIKKNKLWHTPVLYLFYNQNGDFTNFDTVWSQIDIYIKHHLTNG
jgi:hypothetical protein